MLEVYVVDIFYVTFVRLSITNKEGIFASKQRNEHIHQSTKWDKDFNFGAVQIAAKGIKYSGDPDIRRTKSAFSQCFA